MYSGCSHGRACGYSNTPSNYSNSSRIYTNRFPAPYSVPAGLAVDPRTVAPDAALGTAALPKALQSTSEFEAVAGRGNGRQRTQSSTQKSVNVSNVPVSGASNFGDFITEP